MKNVNVTIKDIAKELKVSASTVSRALKDYSGLKKETIKKVKALAKRMNYRPNLTAINLLKKRNNIIAVIVPEINGHFYSNVVTGIQDVVDSTDYNIIICLSNESYRKEVAIIENLSRARISGILVAPSSTTKKFNHFKRFQKNGSPLVIFDRDCIGLDANKVLVDDYSGAFQAVEYLIHSGCKKIAHIGGVLNLTTTSHRLQGYLDALKQNNLPINEDYIIHASGFSHQDGMEPAKLLFQLKNTPDAIFGVNDRIAIAAMFTAKKLNLRIPEDVSIIGFDDEPQSSYFTPALTSVRQPSYGIGMLSARILLKHIKENENPTTGFRYEVFKTELIIRSSSREI
jgi:DNA-binding LacI/PurR family transcriptional regulator